MFDLLFSKPGSRNSIVCVLARASGALPTTRAAQLPGDLNERLWNHRLLVSLLNELSGDDAVALRVRDVPGYIMQAKESEGGKQR